MPFIENKQYTTSFNFEFTDNQDKSVDCHVFLLNSNICVLSFVDGERFVKAVYNQNKKLIMFDNYLNSVITLNHKGINRFTSAVAQALNSNYKISELDKTLIERFELISDQFSIDRNKLRFSLDKNTEITALKMVEFRSSYANEFNSKGYFKLTLLKVDGINFYYCISDYKGNAICKFLFQLEEVIGKDIFHLVQRVNYIEKAKKIDFITLNMEFNQLNSTSEQMHKDYATEDVSFSDACHYSILSKIFYSTNIEPLPLSI